jgi:hypothetical protein
MIVSKAATPMPHISMELPVFLAICLLTSTSRHLIVIAVHQTKHSTFRIGFASIKTKNLSVTQQTKIFTLMETIKPLQIPLTQSVNQIKVSKFALQILHFTKLPQTNASAAHLINLSSI